MQQSNFAKKVILNRTDREMKNIVLNRME